MLDDGFMLLCNLPRTVDSAVHITVVRCVAPTLIVYVYWLKGGAFRSKPETSIPEAVWCVSHSIKIQWNLLSVSYSRLRLCVQSVIVGWDCVCSLL